MSGLTWEIELFGSLKVTSGTQVSSHFRTHKTGLLLAYLACFPHRPHRREELIDLLWPEYELDSGRNCLRIALNALRQQFTTESTLTSAAILADRQHVQLDPQSVTIDKTEFETRLTQAQHSATDEERGAFLKQAVALYRGGLLADYDAVWIPGERQRLADAHLLALRRLIKISVKARALDEALHYAQCAVAADPLREESHRVLMQIYGALGSPGAALRQYQELERVFEESLNSRPSAAARNLLAQITNAPTGHNSGTTSVATLVGNASSAPMSPSPSQPIVAPFTAGVLPVPRTRFFGREECMAQVLEMFDTPETRLITLTGLGGSGKTRLAIAVAERIHADLNGAVWFVPLAAVTTLEGIPTAILKAMSLRSDGTETAIDQIVHVLSGRPSVLVFDNFEQLADQGAPVLLSLLDLLPTLTCLVTSRQRLNVAGEYEYAVLPLATPQSPGTPERLQEFASVQLFVDRARAARRDFELTAANAGAVAALCHYLEGLPLSIELAAAYIQAMTPAQIRARLTPRLPLLVNRQKDAIPRHSSLRATLEWSYQLLPERVGHFLARLSVFRDGWTLEGAEAVCKEPEALECLLQLRERSLVSIEEIGDAMRYRLLEIVREYASEKLTEAESKSAKRLHAEFYLLQAETAETELVGSDAPTWLEALEREHPNLRAALAFALAEAEECANRGAGGRDKLAAVTSAACPSAHVALRLAGALWRFWYLHGHYDEGSDWLEKALGVSDSAAPNAMKAWRGIGNLAYDRGQLDRASTAFTHLLSLARQIGKGHEEAAALGSLGNVALAQGDSVGARLLLEESLALFRKSDNPRGMALVMANLALVTLDSGDPTGACALHKESLALFEQAQDAHNVALAHNNLGHAALQAGDYVAAQQHLLSSLTLARTLGSPFLELYVVVNLTCLLVRQQRWRQAALLCGVADSRLQERRAALLPKADSYYREQRDIIRTALTEEEFLQAWEQGQNMRIHQVETLVGESRATAAH